MSRSDLHEFHGRSYTKRQLSELSGVPYDVLRQRVRIGWTIEQAVTVPTVQQRRRGVASNFPPVSGTGAGSTAQETTNITFSDEDDF